MIRSARRSDRLFQSTHPKRDETAVVYVNGYDATLFQSTHPKRDETVIYDKDTLAYSFQSTHPKRDETAFP